MILSEADFVQRAGGPREPELPSADAQGNDPALQTTLIGQTHEYAGLDRHGAGLYYNTNPPWDIYAPDR